MNDPEEKDREEARLKETLIKKKLTQKKVRRQCSGAGDGGSPAASVDKKRNGSSGKEEEKEPAAATKKGTDRAGATATKTEKETERAGAAGTKKDPETKDGRSSATPTKKETERTGATASKKDTDKKDGKNKKEPPPHGAGSPKKSQGDDSAKKGQGASTAAANTADNSSSKKNSNPPANPERPPRKRRRRRRDRRRRGRRGGGGGGGGGPDFRWGPPPPGPGPWDHRGDPYGRGPPPLRDRYDDRRGPPPGWRGDEWARDRRGRDGPPPRGRPPSPGWRDGRDPRGRGGPPPRGGRGAAGGKGGRSRSVSSRSYSRSPSRSRSYSSSGRSRSRSYSSRSASRSRSRGRARSASRSYSRSPSPAGADGEGKRKRGGGRSRAPSPPPDEATKDQRTVFVSQLVMRADERDIGKYFRVEVGRRVRDVILLRDRRTGRHKGCAYVELGGLDDVPKALAVSGKVPDFQRFPILVKPTEAERNALAGLGGLGVGLEAAMGVGAADPPRLAPDGRRVESQKVYVGSVDRCVTQAQLYALFSQFGPLEKALLQMDMTTGISRGFAFLTYRDPKDANLAIQTMSGQMLAGRALKTGWANQQASATGVLEVKSDEFPEDANAKIQKVNAAMHQLTGTSLTTMVGQVDSSAQQALLAAGPAGALGILPSEQLASVADAALDMALGVAPIAATADPPSGATPAAVAPSPADPPATDPKVIGRSENPSQHILVHSMFDKDEETEQGWEDDIKLDFEEECSQYGTIDRAVVMSKETGGKIYASFGNVESATNCAKNLAGRWFDKRQLRVEFVDSVPDSA